MQHAVNQLELLHLTGPLFPVNLKSKVLEVGSVGDRRLYALGGKYGIHNFIRISKIDVTLPPSPQKS